jgi:sRNA-binding carbon storage regulator CsrA
MLILSEKGNIEVLIGAVVHTGVLLAKRDMVIALDKLSETLG